MMELLTTGKKKKMLVSIETSNTTCCISSRSTRCVGTVSLLLLVSSPYFVRAFLPPNHQHHRAFDTCSSNLLHSRSLSSSSSDVAELDTTTSSSSSSSMIGSTQRRQRLERRKRTPPFESSVVRNRDSDSGAGDTVQMKFRGNKAVTTPPAVLPPMNIPQKSLQNFFADKRHRNLLFFRNEVVDVTNPSAALLQRWSSELKLVGGAELDNCNDGIKNQNVIRIKTTLAMPGLRINTINTIGAKMIPGSSDSLPEYQFTLLDSELSPEGAAPLRWIFQKLTKFRDTTSSFTRVRAIQLSGVDGNKFVFTTDAKLEIRMHIPRNLMKALPGVNAGSFERQGSKSIQKLLEKELEPALMQFRNAYIDWVEDS